MSNVKLSVQWKNSATRAGDNVECTITFKNTSLPENACSRMASLPSSSLKGDSGRESLPSFQEQPQSRKPLNYEVMNLHTKGGTHRSTSSDDSPLSLKQASKYSLQDTSFRTLQDTNHKPHKRSISIVSIGDETLSMDKHHKNFQSVASRKPGRGHGRALSVQVMPRANFMTSKPKCGKLSR